MCLMVTAKDKGSSNTSSSKGKGKGECPRRMARGLNTTKGRISNISNSSNNISTSKEDGGCAHRLCLLFLLASAEG